MNPGFLCILNIMHSNAETRVRRVKITLAGCGPIRGRLAFFLYSKIEENK